MVQAFGFRFSGSGFWGQGFRFSVSGSGVRVQVVGLRVLASGFGLPDLKGPVLGAHRTLAHPATPRLALPITWRSGVGPRRASSTLGSLDPRF